MQCERLAVHAFRNIMNLTQCERKAFCLKDGCLPLTFGLQHFGFPAALSFEYSGLFVTGSNSYGSFSLTIGFSHHRPSIALSSHLPGHRLFNSARRHNLSDFDCHDADAPAVCDLIQFLVKHLVNFIPF